MIASLTFPLSLPPSATTAAAGGGVAAPADDAAIKTGSDVTRTMIHRQWIAIWQSLCDHTPSSSSSASSSTNGNNMMVNALEWDIMVRLHRDENDILIHREYHITALSI
jgi:hypothetical protein